MLRYRRAMVARTPAQRERVMNMIRTLQTHTLILRDTEDELVQLVNHFIHVNEKIQEIVWIGGLKEDESKYQVLRETLGYPNLVGLLDMVWTKLKVHNFKDDNKNYRRLVNNYIKEYIDWGAKRTAGASIGVSTRKGHHKKLGVPLPRVNYKLDKDLRIRIIRSFPVLGMWLYT